jgi:microcystin-dependent protein
MASPIRPDQFCDAVPSANADFCTRFTKFLNVTQLLCDLFSWMLNSDGSLTNEFKAEVAQFTTPTGAYMYFATLNVGDGWLYCDGREVSRSTYANLFAAVGTVFGAGDGTTTFNIPDGRGRSMIGSGTGGGLTAFRDINNPYTGEETHVQTLAEMAPHTHDWDGPSTRTEERGAGANLVWRGTLVDQTTSAGGGSPMNITHACLVGHLHIKT